MSVALGDPPATTPATTIPAPAANPPTVTPAATPAAAATPTPAAASPPAVKAAVSRPATAPAIDQYERHFLAEGYKLEMHNGEKLFCRSEELLGSHLGGRKVCSSLEQLKANEPGARESVERWQRNSPTPSGR
jgi:hypothetical protein